MSMRLLQKALFWGVWVCIWMGMGVEAQAQRTCGTDSVHAHMMGLPGYAVQHMARQQAVRDALQAQGAAQGSGNRSECDTPLLIPVAVHFQGTGIDMACAIDMALSQVETLNADFAATNADIGLWEAGQTAIWPNIQNAESCIQFCLATLNHPAGFGLQEGDYAITLNETTGDFDAAWSGYLNFFVRTIGGGVLGYSPLGGNGNGDGVTVDPAYFGSVSCGGNTVSAPFHLGRTMTHEVGHYLFLEHPWGAGGCGSTDFVGDTPVTNSPQFGCPAGQTIVQCTDPILWPTYMEYCDDACLFMFSAGQVDRMETYVEQNLQNLLTHAVTACQEAACIGFDVAVARVNESCSGGDGSVALNIAGGTAPFSMTLNGMPSASGTWNGLVAGPFTVAVEDVNGCTFSQDVTLVREAPDLEVVAVVHEYCSDGAGSIEVVAQEPTPFLYSLNGAGSGVPTGLFTGLSAGSYTVTASNATGCSGTVAVAVNNESDLVVQVARRDVSCTWLDNGAIEAAVSGGTDPISYVLDEVWPSDDGVWTGLATGVHTLFVEDAVGCQFQGSYALGFDFTIIGEDCPCMVYVPNALTPDNDGRNDALRIEASCPIALFHLRIFDRWGVQVFESFDPEKPWIGGVDTHYVSSDTYGYVLSFTWGDGDSKNVRPEVVTGTVTVIR